jgi:type II secretory pathway component PulF
VAYLVPELEDLFRNFETEVPDWAQLAFDTYVYWFVFLIAGVGGYALVFWYGNRRGWYLLAIAILSAVILLLLTVWVMYGPAIELGKAI